MSFKKMQLPRVVLAELYKDLAVADELVGAGKPDSGVNSIEIEKIAASPSAEVSSKKAGETTTKTAVAKTAPVAVEIDSYKILGNNRRKVTVIVNYPHEAFIPEDDLQVVTKILGACKLNLGDIALINNSSNAAEIEKIKEQLQPDKILLFGVSPSEIGLPISFPEYKQQNYAGTIFVSAPSITKMNGESEENKLIKRKLWECLKTLFT